MPKTTLGITGLNEILGRDYGIEEPYWGPLCLRRVNDQSHFCAGSVHTIRYRINPVQYEHSLKMKKANNRKDCDEEPVPPWSACVGVFAVLKHVDLRIFSPIQPGLRLFCGIHINVSWLAIYYKDNFMWIIPILFSSPI